MTYRRFLDVVKSSIDGFEPQALHVDFELPMLKELESAFPSAGIVGCAFHFNQSIWRYVQRDESLREKYLESLDFALKFRIFCALAYVPEEEVGTAFEAILAPRFVKVNEKLLRLFMNYFEKTWIGRERNPPLFKTEWWNLYKVASNGMSRTTNEVESWHSNFAGRLGLVHPKVCKLIEGLRVEQARTQFVVSNTQAQGRANKPKAVYRDRSLRLEQLVESYPRRKLMGFLMSCAHMISF